MRIKFSSINLGNLLKVVEAIETVLRTGDLETFKKELIFHGVEFH